MTAPVGGGGASRPRPLTAAWLLAGRVGLVAARRPGRFLLAVLGAWACVRALTLATSVGFIDPEGDLKFGHLAKDLLEGLVAPARLYRPYPREGGALPFGVFVAPFFALLGPSYLALKVAAVAFMALAVAPWVDLARRAGGPAAGLTMALLLVLPTSFYLSMESSVANVPTHAGGLVFSGLAYWLLYRGFGDGTLRRDAAALLAGLAAGLGVFWVLTSGPIALGVAATALLMGARLRHLLLLGAGALPGALLAWWFCLARAVSSGDSLFATLASRRAEAGLSAELVLRHLWTMVTGYFPRLAGFTLEPGELTAGWLRLLGGLSHLAYGLLLAAALVLLPRWGGRGAAGRRAFLRLLPAVPLYLAAYLVANPLVIDPRRFDLYRYFLPLLPFAWLAVALAVARLPRLLPRAGRPAAMVAFGLVGLVGATSVAAAVAGGRFPSPLRLVRGYSPAYALRLPRRPETFLAGLRRPGRMDYDFLATGLGASDPAPPDPRRAARRWRLPPSLRVSYWEGVAMRMRQRLEAGRTTVAAVRRAALLGGPRQRAAFMRGFAIGRFPLPVDAGANRELLRWIHENLGDLPRRALLPLLRGAAQGIGRAMLLHPEDPTLPPLPADLHADVQTGLAVAMGRALLPWRPWPAGLPLPGLVAPAARLAPRRFARIMEAERRRQDALYRRYAAVAPVAAASGGRP